MLVFTSNSTSDHLFSPPPPPPSSPYPLTQQPQSDIANLCQWLSSRDVINRLSQPNLGQEPTGCALAVGGPWLAGGSGMQPAGVFGMAATFQARGTSASLLLGEKREYDTVLHVIVSSTGQTASNYRNIVARVAISNHILRTATQRNTLAQHIIAALWKALNGESVSIVAANPPNPQVAQRYDAWLETETGAGAYTIKREFLFSF